MSCLSFTSALELLTSLFLESVELLVMVTFTLSVETLAAAAALAVVVAGDDDALASSVEDFLESTISSL